MDAEALAYVSNASLSQPIASDWVDIYMYLLTRVMGEKVPEELRKESLDSYRMEELKGLKEWLWRKRVKERGEAQDAESQGQGGSRGQVSEATGDGPLKQGPGILWMPFLGMLFPYYRRAAS